MEDWQQLELERNIIVGTPAMSERKSTDSNQVHKGQVVYVTKQAIN